MITITFLGTSAMIPTKERNHSSILISYKDQGILIDCGEGTQRQLRIAGIKPGKITKLLITHWHGDHTLGIPGLIQNLAAHNYKSTLEIYGPKGSKKYLKSLLSGIVMQERIKYEVKELSSGIFYKNSFTLEAAQLNHIIPCLAYSFKEKDRRKINLNYLKKFDLTQHPLLGDLQKGKNIVYKGKKILASKATNVIPGKKITIIMDTAPANSAVKIAKNSDILIAESTWSKDLEKFVMKRKHLTAEIAAKMAKQANAKKLILTHFSQRYNDIDQLEMEAKKVFKNTILAEDFMQINV
ncbi:ribonuclease Z [Candidatus Woesearchaeota archaeon]|nr:ribonuclease Z [Candidatus Woesearchaeota archaeon]